MAKPAEICCGILCILIIGSVFVGGTQNCSDNIIGCSITGTVILLMICICYSIIEDDEDGTDTNTTKSNKTQTV